MVSTARLSSSSCLVLGLVASFGPATPYELKQLVKGSIGHFWSFPHSQIYSEADRLSDAGLLAVEQEEGGRRRKQFSITPAGTAALRDWLHDPTPEPWEIRDPGLLKLFFGSQAESEDMAAIARRQVEVHQERLELFEGIEANIREDASVAYPYATLRLGMAVTRACIEFWTEIAASPPDINEEQAR